MRSLEEDFGSRLFWYSLPSIFELGSGRLLLGINPAPVEARPDAQPNVTSSRGRASADGLQPNSQRSSFFQQAELVSSRASPGLPASGPNFLGGRTPSDSPRSNSFGLPTAELLQIDSKRPSFNKVLSATELLSRRALAESPSGRHSGARTPQQSLLGRTSQRSPSSNFDRPSTYRTLKCPSLSRSPTAGRTPNGRASDSQQPNSSADEP